MGRVFGKAALLWVGGIIVVLLMVASLMFATGTLQRLTANWRGETEAIERTQGDGSFQVSVYEHFFGLCSQVQSKESAIEALEEELETTNPSDFRKQQIQTNLTALRSSRAELIHEYNADAANKHREDFLDSDLPPSLDEDNEETECHA